MHTTTMIARLAKEICDVLSRTRWAEDHHVPVLLEDVRARLDWMSMELEDVVLAGIYRLGHVPAKIASWVEEEYRPEVYLDTVNWREEIRTTLEFHRPDLAWRYRTFLKVLLTKGAIAPDELTYANSIVRHARVAPDDPEVRAREDAEGDADGTPDHYPPSQLKLV